LITGSTGYFGSLLTCRLLASGADCWCLVRAADERAAASRLMLALRQWQHAAALPQGRLKIVRGDVTYPDLGLSRRDYAAIAGQVTSIFHGAAIVNGSFPPAALERANVEGTARVAELARRSGAWLGYFSSSAVTREINPGDGAPAGPAPTDLAAASGYAQTKWLAEQWIVAARADGVRADIFRLGALAGDRTAGLPNPRDYRWLVLCNVIDLRAAPFVDVAFDWLAVDAACDGVLRLWQRERSGPGSLWHLQSSPPVPWLEVFSWLRRLGYPVDMMDAPNWYASLAARAAAGDRRAAMLTAMPPMAVKAPDCPPLQPSATARPPLDGIELPPFTLDDLRRMLAHHPGGQRAPAGGMAGLSTRDAR
jgi:thioester reductase-like protein